MLEHPTHYIVDHLSSHCSATGILIVVIRRVIYTFYRRVILMLYGPCLCNILYCVRHTISSHAVGLEPPRFALYRVLQS